MIKKIMFLLCVGGYSGAENMTLLTAGEFVRRGYEVSYCSPGGEIEGRLRGCDKGIKYAPLRAFRLPEIRKAVKKLRPDLIYAVDFKVSLAAALLGVRYMVHLHNNPGWIRRFSPFTMALWYAMEHSQANICVSGSIMREFVLAHRIRNTTITLLNVVDAEKIRRLGSEPAGERYDLGFIGRITEQKDPLRFIELARGIRDCLGRNIHAIMIGPDGGLMEACRDRIGEYELDIQWTGFQDNPYQYIHSCRLILMPSKWEGFGLTAVESMVLGVPVLASPVGGLPDVIGEEVNLCESDEQFVQRSVMLLTDEFLYRDASCRARQQSALFTDIAGYVDCIEKLFSV